MFPFWKTVSRRLLSICSAKLPNLEDVVIAVANHTNRENPRATKGETLEAIAALELVLLAGDGEWFDIYVGKNCSGPGGRKIGRVKYTSVFHDGVDVAVVDVDFV